MSNRLVDTPGQLNIPGVPMEPDPERVRAGIYPEQDWEAIVEAVLFTMGNSVELKTLAIAIDQNESVTRRVVESLQKRYREEHRGIQIIELEQSYQMCTRSQYYENLIRVASAPKKHVLTEVVLETLSIIAYKQPVTKMEISKIRGVSSDHAVNRLVEYGLVYEVGRLDAPGRPALFGTTEEFLRRFGVVSSDDLPSINPEQEADIIQAVEEELQLHLDESGKPIEEAAKPADALEKPIEELMEEAEYRTEESEDQAEEQVDQPEKQADQAEKQADQAEKQADQTEEQADQPEKQTNRPEERKDQTEEKETEDAGYQD